MSIIDRLRPQPNFCTINGVVVLKIEDGVQTFVPKNPEDLPRVQSAVKKLDEARSGRGDIPELDKEEAEEDLLELCKTPQIISPKA